MLQGAIDRVDQTVFDWIYGRSLVYNTCWEDPAVDRRALNLQPEDRMLVITSAGCNVLDYALTGVSHIDAIDANPRQSALLELKLACLRHLEFDDFFRIFGSGYHPAFDRIYRRTLRLHLGDFARRYWDDHNHWFQSPHRSFYYRGLSGMVAQGFAGYLHLRPSLHGGIRALLEARSLEEQREIYDHKVQPYLWNREIEWTLSRQITLSLLGVPHPQRKEVQRQHDRGVAGFVRECIEYVFRSLPLQHNYFWTLYLRGHYTHGCCPEYLRPDNFQRLKADAHRVVNVTTATVTEFLQKGGEPISKFVLLDHMDWMSSYRPDDLRDEWHAILDRAAPGARIIFRSAHMRPQYLERLSIGARRLRDLLHFRDGLAWALQPLDRVHTYAGFHIADVPQ